MIAAYGRCHPLGRLTLENGERVTPVVVVVRTPVDAPPAVSTGPVVVIGPVVLIGRVVVTGLVVSPPVVTGLAVPWTDARPPRGYCTGGGGVVRTGAARDARLGTAATPRA